MAKIISKIKASNTDYGIRAGYMYYGTTTGTESALTVTIKEDGGNTISIPELVKGMTFALTFHVIPSTSATLSVNGLTGKPIHYDNGLTGKEWVIGETYVFIYNGTAFVAISSYDDYTVSVTGSGNAITSISKTGRNITATKGSTFLTAHPTISKSTNTTSTQSVAHQGSFTVIDNVTTDGNGHVTKVNTKTVTLPSDIGEVNQNAFSNVVVGSTTIAADSKTDTLTLVAGSNITLTPDATNDKITINATDTNTWRPIGDNIDKTDSATSASLTAVKTAYDKAIAAYNLADGKASTNVATTSANGLMSSTDKSKLNGIASGAEVNVQSDWNETTTTSDAYIKNKPSSLKNPNSLTIGSKSYDGSTPISISAQDLGLDSALKYCGVTTTKLADGATTNPIVINNSNHTATTGCVVFYSSKEFVYDGAKWAELGDGSNHKIKQTAVSSPSASGSATAFIDTISQDANGQITVTKKNVNFPTIPTSFSITANATDDDVVILTGSGGANSVTYDAKHAQKGPSSGYTSGNTTTSISGSGGSGTIKIPQITVDKYGHVTAAADESVTITLPTLPTVGNGTVTINQAGTKVGSFTMNQSGNTVIDLTDNNTDTKVTAVGNHYTPSGGSAATATASGSTLSFGGAVITGVTKDAAGHVTGVTTSNLPANPNTDTHYTSKNIVTSSATGTSNATTSENGKVYLNHLEEGTVTSSNNIVGSGGTSVTSDASGNIKISSPTIPSSLKNPNSLTIQKNGTTVASYDGSAAKTANITVPTKVSELTNDSNYTTATGHTHNYAGSSSAGGSATSADKLTTARNINGVSFNGTQNITVYSPFEISSTNALSKQGWYRVASITQLGTISTFQWYLSRNYANSNNESYIFTLTYAHGNAHFTQLNSTVNTQLISNVRLIINSSVPHTSSAYLEIYYNSNYSNSVYSQIYGNTIGTALTFKAENFTEGSIPDGYKAIEFKPSTTQFKGDIEGNCSGSSSSCTGNAATATTASKLGTANKGSATNPIYLSQGVPTACTYSLNKTVPADAVFTDNDTKVTSAANHYSPSTDTSSALSVDASSSTAATWGTTQLVTGVNISRDSKGHVTGLTVDSIKMPANPNSDTHYKSLNIVGASATATANATATNGNVYLNHVENGSVTSKHNIVGTGATTVVSDGSGNIVINSPSVGETNQNAFSNVVVGSTTIAADSKTDTLTLVAGSNITLTPDATNDKITIAATDTNTHNLSKNIIGGQNATANSSQSNGSVYLTHIENSEVTSTHQITGTGSTTVKCDGSGNIVINSPSSLKNPASLTIQGNGTNIATYDGSAAVTANIPAASTSAYGVTKLSDAVNSTSTALAATANAVKKAYDLAASKTANTGTVTKVSTGAGLTGGDITATGTIKANLNSETSLGTIGSTSKLYAVGVDANNKLCVNVPWTDNNTHNLSKNIIGAQNATANSSQVNGSVYLTHIENSEVTSSHQITGGGGTTVKCDGSGNIVISSGTIPTIPTVNNATVTIKQNNSNKGSFTLNQTSAATINLTDTIFNPSESLRVSGEFLQDQNGDLETFTCDSDVENPYVTFSLTDASEGEKLIHGRQLQLVGESGVSIRGSNEGKIFFNVDGGVGEQGPRGYQGYQGYQGTAGTNGTSAGFGTPTASVDANVGTPSVTVTASGGNTAKVFNFAFKNLKGAPGADGSALTYVNKSDATVCNGSYTWDISSTTRSYTTYNGGGTITITSSSTPRNCNEHYLLIRNCGGSADTGVVTFTTSIGPLIAKSNTINIPVNGYVEVSVVYIPSAGFTGSNKPTLVLTCSEAMTQVI